MRFIQPKHVVPLLLLALPALSRAAERVTLRNGFTLDCVRREAAGEPVGTRLRLYLDAADANYMDVSASAIASRSSPSRSAKSPRRS